MTNATIEPYLDRLYSAAYRLTRHRADAEELVQETCLRAFSKQEAWDEAASPLGWLMRVQYRIFIDEVRKGSRQNVVSLNHDENAELATDRSFDPIAHAAGSEQIRLVERAWLKLKKEQRALLAFRVEGYSLAQMDEIFGIGVDAISARLRRARKSLVRLLREEELSITDSSKMEHQR